MEIQVDIEFEQLLKIVKKLPAAQQSALKAELEKKGVRPGKKDTDLEAFLLEGPTFSKKQISTINQSRKAINQWRLK